ncbi:RidA family protein [Dyella caseinilytica]|uniref:RidA family protein n=1 Tax=Dyella caseinilytica TaxID=1849581 RepID=A0ABX7GXW1_9GAMM|nr:RidA family protein [Dyella caseinilytica]QRN55328.1 RidA family protein [Dyella caseinilytica]GGA00962.1 enamine deaminase RidA [Dyella caseinilytica]
MSEPVFSNPDTLFPPPGYSQLVEVTGGKLVFVAGQVALDKGGSLVGAGNFARQADQVFQNLRAAIESRGGTLKDIIKFTMFVTDITQLPALREVRDRHLVGVKNPPASTLVQVSGLFRPEFLIEIEAVAWLGA